MFLEHEPDRVIQEPPAPLSLGAPIAGAPFRPAHGTLSLVSSLNAISLGRPPLTEGPGPNPVPAAAPHPHGCEGSLRGVVLPAACPSLLHSARRGCPGPTPSPGRPVGRVHASALPHTAASVHGLSQEQGQGSGGLGPEVRGGSGLDVAPEALQRGPLLPLWASVSRGVGWRGGFGLRVLSVPRENVLVWTHASGHGQSLPEPRSRLRWPWDPRNSFSASRPSTRPERGAQAHRGSRSRPALRGGATTPSHRRGAGPPGTAAVPRSCVPGVSQAPEVCGAFGGGRSHAGWEPVFPASASYSMAFSQSPS